MALLVAQAQGKEAMQTTIRTMAAAAFTPGLSPLHVFGLLATEDYPAAVELLRGASPQAAALPGPTAAHTDPDAQQQAANGARLGAADRAMTPALTQVGTAASVRPGGTDASAPARAAFVPRLPGTEASAPPPWHATLIMLAAHRSAPDAMAVGALGDRLWDAPVPNRGQSGASSHGEVERDRVAAHICYMLAGRAAESAFDADARFVLPGADHAGSPSMLATADALQRADMHAWCLQQSLGAPMYVMVPYYLLVRCSSTARGANQNFASAIAPASSVALHAPQSMAPS